MGKSLENINHLTLEGKVMAIYDPTEEVIAAGQAVSLTKKPRFGVSIMLAVLNKNNRNHHHITLAQADKAIASYGDRQEIPGNLDHKTGAYGTSYKLWVKGRDEDEPQLWLEAIYWNRYINETKKAELIAAYNNSQLGASWEIDKPFKLVAADDGSETIYIEDFAFAGFGLMVNDPPAEPETLGTGTITAQLESDPGFWGDSVAAVLAATEVEKKAQERRSTKYGIEIKEGGNVTKPAKYKSVTTANFADPVNFKWPVDKAHISAAVSYFNHDGMRVKGHYTTTEWSKIGRKIALKADEGYEYKGGKIVTPREEAEVNAKHVMRTNSYGELPVDFLRAIACPTCGAWSSVTMLDFKEGKFELECDNGHYDINKPSHKYLVKVEVEEQGEVTSSYHLAPVESSEVLRERTFGDGEIIEVALVATTQQTEEVNTVEKEKKFTEEEMKAAVDKAEKASADKLKADQEALTKQKKDVDDQVASQVKEQVKEAEKNAVAAYQAKEAEATTRIEAAHKAKPYASDEEKETAKAELLAMTQEEFDRFVEMRELQGKNALLEAQLAGNATEALTARLNLGLPLGEDVEGDAVKEAAAAKERADSDARAARAWSGV